MKKRTYTQKDIKKLRWQEIIRLRPGMYIGQVNNKGLVELLKNILTQNFLRTGSHAILIDLKKNFSGRIIFENIQKPVIDNIAIIPQPFGHSKWVELPSLNALCQKMEVLLLDKNEKKLIHQVFEEGKLKQGQIDNKEWFGKRLEIHFQLDNKIWKDNFQWNENYILHEIREFAYLHKQVKFELQYQIGEEPCRTIYHFKNGLQERIELEKLNGSGSSYFDTAFEAQIAGFEIEIAFAFREYSVDAAFLKSYVNDYYTYENGTHVDALLKGLTYGVMKYFQKYDLTEVYKISEKGMKENLIAAINIKMEAPLFSGCVRNKLANSEIIEPIANYVSELFFEKIEQDEVATQKLIRKFKI